MTSPSDMTDDAAGPETYSGGRPVVRLRPKAEARAIRWGFPWVYADELVTDRRTGNLAPGALAVLEDAERKVLGLVTVNTKSKIIARMIDRDVSAVVDQAWFAAKFRAALALRERLFDAPYYRLIHAEADGLPGVVVDRFGDVAVVQPNAAWAEMLLEPLVAALTEVTGVTTVVKNGTGRSRALEGLTEETVVLQGAVSGPVPVPMNGATYMADLLGGQKTGLFYDQRPNHAFAARLAKGGRVLDVFAHVGGFGLAAFGGGCDLGFGRRCVCPGLGPCQQRGAGVRVWRGVHHPSGRCIRGDGGAGAGSPDVRCRDLRSACLCAVQTGAGGGASGL